jgi:hypothetical protein
MWCTGGSGSFLGEKRPDLGEISRNGETGPWKWAETQVLGKGGITQEHLMIFFRLFLQNTAGGRGNRLISSIFQFEHFLRYF